MIGMEMDAGFDGGEFSSAYHLEMLEDLEPCGICPACHYARADRDYDSPHWENPE